MNDQEKLELEDIAYDLVLAHLESFEYLTVVEELAETGDSPEENANFVFRKVIETLKELRRLSVS